MGLGGLLLQGLAAVMTTGTMEPVEAQSAAPQTGKVRSGCDAASTAVTGDMLFSPGCGDDPNAVEGVTVQGAPRGKTEGPVEPELVFDEEAIKAFGAGNIAELLAAIEPLTRSSRGRGGDEAPILLINGQRTSGFQEMRGVPPEAIFKMEILREEAALAYGYRADQKVVNFILKPNFRAVTLQTDGREATEGGRGSTEQQANLFKVDKIARWTLDLKYHRDSPLYEQERDIVRAAGSSPYDLQGTIVGASGGEIDPALSALAGSTVTRAAVPASAAAGAPVLADFVAGAGRVADDDLTASRTLQPRTEEGSIQGAYTRSFNKITATVSGNLESASRIGFLGLTGASVAIPADSPFSPFARSVTLYRYFDDPAALRRKVDTSKAEAGLTMLGMMSGWRWTFEGQFDRSDTATRIGKGLDVTAFRAAVAAGDASVNPFGAIPQSLVRYAAPDTADSVTTNAKGELTLAGTLADLPAGRLRATFKGGFDSRKIDSESVRSGVRIARSFTRDRATFQSSLDAPIAERGGVLGVLGEVSINSNLVYEQFSDLGSLITAGGGVAWSPIKRLNLSANYSREEGEPTPQQLYDPTLQTPNVSMYDFATGQSVVVTRIDGGNANLSPDSRRVVKLSINYRPFEARNLSLYANYTASQIKDQIASFPTISPELEAAFPERFTRDAAGRLTQIDSRPVNFAHADRQELRWGVNYSFNFGGAPLPAGAPKARSSEVVARGGGVVVRSGGGRPGAGFVNLSLSHLWRLQDAVVIRDGLAPLDLLAGAALGRRGGTPRHEVTLQANISKNGVGGSARGVWKSSTWVNGGADGENLYFSDLPTLNLQVFADLDARKAWLKRHPELKGARLTLGVDNLFNTKQTVRDDRGLTPQAYQKDYMDPLGRTVRLNLRKQF